MSEQITPEQVAKLISRWVAQHNRTDERAAHRHTMCFTRRAGGLTVEDRTTFHYRGDDREDGELDTVGICTIATFNSQVVFEEVGGRIETYVVGEWLQIIAPPPA